MMNSQKIEKYDYCHSNESRTHRAVFQVVRRNLSAIQSFQYLLDSGFRRSDGIMTFYDFINYEIDSGA